MFCVLRPISELIFYPFHINQLRRLNHCQALCHQIQSFNHFLFKATIVIVDKNDTRQQDRHIRQHQFQPRPTASALITSRQAYFSSSLLLVKPTWIKSFTPAETKTIDSKSIWKHWHHRNRWNRRLESNHWHQSKQLIWNQFKINLKTRHHQHRRNRWLESNLEKSIIFCSMLPISNQKQLIRKHWQHRNIPSITSKPWNYQLTSPFTRYSTILLDMFESKNFKLPASITCLLSSESKLIRLHHHHHTNDMSRCHHWYQPYDTIDTDSLVTIKKFWTISFNHLSIIKFNHFLFKAIVVIIDTNKTQFQPHPTTSSVLITSCSIQSLHF